jgi:hypothetical protein
MQTVQHLKKLMSQGNKKELMNLELMHFGKSLNKKVLGHSSPPPIKFEASM